MSKNRKYKAKLFGSNDLMPCFYCEDLLDFEAATVEHLIPQSLGGSNNIKNLAISCVICNTTHKNLLDIINN